MSAKTASVKLLKPHRHAGRDYKPGDTITLAEHKAQWLASTGVAEHVKPDTAAAEKPAAAPAPTAKPKE